MMFSEALFPDTGEILRLLGYGGAAPDARDRSALEAAAAAVAREARPRFTARRLALCRQGASPVADGGPLLPGRDIAAHLAGCGACFILALTLGGGVDALLRAWSAADPAAALWADAAASALAEQYADLAEARLRAGAEAEGLFLTGRFSPGYGDFPLALQQGLLQRLDARRAIGLAATESRLLTPRKSITALLGLSERPTLGRPAGCADCALYGRCPHRRKEPAHACPNA